MRKTLIATAICLAIGFALPAMADDTQTGWLGCQRTAQIDCRAVLR